MARSLHCQIAPPRTLETLVSLEHLTRAELIAWMVVVYRLPTQSPSKVRLKLGGAESATPRSTPLYLRSDGSEAPRSGSDRAESEGSGGGGGGGGAHLTNIGPV